MNYSVKQLLYYECGFLCLKLEAFRKMLLYVNYNVHNIVFVFPNRLPEKQQAALGFVLSIITSRASPLTSSLVQKMNAVQMWRAGCKRSVFNVVDNYILFMISYYLNIICERCCCLKWKK